VQLHARAPGERGPPPRTRADERSVDVDEPKSPEPPAGRRPTGVPPSVRLSPLQEAWRAYVEHTLYLCDTCRRVDGSPCETAEGLYRAYWEIGKRVTAQVRDASPGGAALPPRQ